MTGLVAAIANSAIAVPYLAIALAITPGLLRSGQWRHNLLGTATATIFFTCAVGHGVHAVTYLVTPAHVGPAPGWLSVLGIGWDIATAIVGLWYWTLRGRFPALVRGVAVFEDLRLRQAAERRLRLSERRYREIVETTSEGVVVLDPLGAVEYANARFAALVGRDQRDLRGTTFTQMVAPAHRAVVEAALVQVGTEGPQRLEVELAVRWPPPERRTHAHVQIALSARGDVEPAPAERGRDDPGVAPLAGGALAMVTDVTERRNVEAQLRQAQRLDAVGQLAGGVAHDFNNLLTVIDGYAAILQAGVDGPARDDVTAIRDAAARASALTRQLLAFSRTQSARSRAVDVNELVGGLEGMLTRLIREDIQVVVRAQADPATVWADPGQLEQVLVNLAVNSRDAMPHGGQLTISTGYQPGTDGSGHVMLAVADTGSGIPEEVRDLIFEPFFTTKEPGQGTGLGLSTVYGIVRQAGGEVRVHSTVGVGTEVQVLLPATPSAARPRGPGQIDQLAGGKGTVLLAEDDAEVRRLTERILLTAGYDVLTAANGREALEVAESAATIDLLVTDMMMPKMNGRQLADRLRDARPGLPVLYLSAYHPSQLSPDLRLAAVAHIEKPYSPALLTAKISELLAAARKHRAGQPTAAGANHAEPPSLDDSAALA